jgi:hypothetical protein
MDHMDHTYRVDHRSSTRQGYEDRKGGCSIVDTFNTRLHPDEESVDRGEAGEDR